LKSEKNQNFFHPAQKTVLDCKASLKCFEIQTSNFQQIGISPEQLKSKRFKKFLKYLKSFLNCLQKP